MKPFMLMATLEKESNWPPESTNTEDTVPLSVKTPAQGLGWNIWLGLVSMVIPIYSSGGLYGSIEHELEKEATGNSGVSSLPAPTVTSRTAAQRD